jgi:hypothetical protein
MEAFEGHHVLGKMQCFWQNFSPQNGRQKFVKIFQSYAIVDYKVG